MKKTLIAIVAMLALSGCASVMNTGDSGEFACPGMPKGVVCKGPREVYELTNGDVSSVSQDSLEKKETLPNDKIVEKPVTATTTPVELAYAPSEAGIQPEPLVTQTRVLRIWIAPWVDKSNNLHWPGLMFAKIQKSEWNFGQDSFEGVEPPVPHLLDSASASMPATQDQGSTQPSEDQGSTGSSMGTAIPGQPIQ